MRIFLPWLIAVRTLINACEYTCKIYLRYLVCFPQPTKGVGVDKLWARVAHALTWPHLHRLRYIVCVYRENTTRCDANFVPSDRSINRGCHGTAFSLPIWEQHHKQHKSGRKFQIKSVNKKRKVQGKVQEKLSSACWPNVLVFGCGRPSGGRCCLLCVPCAGAVDVHLHDDVHHGEGEAAGDDQLL